MNKARRNAISEIIEKLETLKYEIGELQEEEQDGYYNMPENLQYSDRGEAKKYKTYQGAYNAARKMGCNYDVVKF